MVGARCAGSPTAMLLARKGYKVLVVDRAKFPSDTLSTHILHPPAVESMQRWGLLDRLVATGCPPIDTYTFDTGPFTLAGAPGTDAAPVAYCPRRTVLDKLLVDAASEAGAEVREEFAVQEIVVEDDRVVGIRGHGKDGAIVTEHADVVVGADGRSSFLAKAVDPAQYNERPPFLGAYYTYWSGLPMDGRFEMCLRPGCGFAAAPTHDDLTLVIAGWSYDQYEAKRDDVEAHYVATFDIAPGFAERIRGAKREARFAGTAVPNFFRKPYGPGWALVGDAGYNKDFITAQGILDAFRDAELCATALDEAFSATRSYDEGMAGYHTTRDAHVLPMFEFTCQLAALEPPPPELQALLEAAHGNQEAMDGFARVNAGVLSPAEYFSEENVHRIFAAAAHTDLRASTSN
ncbi:MAG TPA: NAD(P)/FAD-dependent oxidoreductase [Ilumatobacteraceae bacterium]|nr:NAD(P)/FAD-dependent oxidoreductase [Ilumatobacteraceae bacterium]